MEPIRVVRCTDIVDLLERLLRMRFVLGSYTGHGHESRETESNPMPQIEVYYKYVQLLRKFESADDIELGVVNSSECSQGGAQASPREDGLSDRRIPR